MTAHAFWRFVIVENNGGNTVNLSSIQLKEFADSKNLIGNNVNFSGIEPIQSNEILWKFATPISINLYSFQAQGESAPKSWRLEFSDNQADWFIAHIEYAQTHWQTGETRYFANELFELNLMVEGSNAARNLNLIIADLHGNLILKTVAENHALNTILMPNKSPVMVTLLQECGDVWQAGKFYQSGSLVFPTSPEKPFYYRNQHNGFSDLIEPTWSENPEILNHDSECLWELVERLNKPITHAPLIPTRKI